MAPVTPAWLNAQFVEKVLKNSQHDESIQIRNIMTKPATAKGDNYSSDMIRVTVEYSCNKTGHRITEKQSLIVKIAPTVASIHKDMINDIGVFEIEMKMMGKTLKQMNEMVNEDDYRFGAKLLYSEIGDPSLLVIEDLAPLGYRMADRQSGLDLQHSMLAIRRLAKFHASSVALCEKEPEQKLSYKRGIFSMDYPEVVRKFFFEGMKTLGKEVANWPELGPSYSEKLLKLADVCYGKAADCSKRNDDEFNVINHGDFWVNNMLFRYNDKGNVNDHIFVDFQMCVYTSPAIDIQYFLHTSISDEVDLYNRDALLEEYLDTLGRTMSKHDCKTKPPSMATLMKSLKEREFYGIISACAILPIIRVGKNEAKSLDEMLRSDGGYDNPGYNEATFRQVMIRKLPEWNSRGLLDV